MNHWYNYKAKQCLKMMREAIGARTRADLKATRKIWLELAAKAEKEDRLPFRAPSGGSVNRKLNDQAYNEEGHLELTRH